MQAEIKVWDDIKHAQLEDLAKRGGSNSGVESFEDYRQILSQPDFRYIEVNKLVPSKLDPLGTTPTSTDAEKALDSFLTKVFFLFLFFIF